MRPWTSWWDTIWSVSLTVWVELGKGHIGEKLEVLAWPFSLAIKLRSVLLLS